MLAPFDTKSLFLTQATPHAVECVAVLILRALGMFSQLYLRAPDHLIGAVVMKILEALGDTGVVAGASMAQLTARRKVSMSVLHKIGSA